MSLLECCIKGRRKHVILVTLCVMDFVVHLLVYVVVLPGVAWKGLFASWIAAMLPHAAQMGLRPVVSNAATPVSLTVRVRGVALL